MPYDQPESVAQPGGSTPSTTHSPSAEFIAKAEKDAEEARKATLIAGDTPAAGLGVPSAVPPSTKGA